MTTIAYKDGVIAYDSYLTADGVIIDHDFQKKWVVDGVVFFFTGATSDFQKFIDVYFGRLDSKQVEASAFVLDAGNLYQASVCEETGLWKQPLLKNKHYTLGSGKAFALTAMDMGASAKEAVKMAAYRDMGTGGKVRTHVI